MHPKTALRRRLRFFLAALAVCVALPFAAYGQIRPVNVALAEADALLLEERFDEALAILRPLAMTNPGNDDVVFLTGIAAMEGARRMSLGDETREALLDEAIALFRVLLISDPSLDRVRLELARAFYFKEEDGLAREHFERVLAGDVPETVVANVQEFLDSIRARRRWNVHFGFALQPDTNIGGASNERIIYIGGLPFVRDVNELTTSGVGLSVWTGGEYQYPIEGRPLLLRMGGNFSRKEYKGGEFDEMNLSAHAGPRWLVDRDTELSLLGTLGQRWVSDSVDSDEWGTRFEFGRRLSPLTTVNARTSASRRQYRNKKYLDGWSLNLSLGGSWTVSPIVRLNGTFGFVKDHTESERWRNSSRSVATGVQVLLPWGFTAGADARVEWKDYEGNWGIYTGGVPREDRTRTLSASVFNRGLTILGFSPKLTLFNDVRKTNAQLHDYKRNRGELQFVRQF